MSTIRFPDVPFTAQHLTDSELVRHVEHHYPNLSGPLRVMFLRYARRASETVPCKADDKSCPHCGTRYEDES